MNNENDVKVLFCAAVVFVLLFLVLLTVAVAREYSIFRTKRDYLRMEIQRTSGDEQGYWKSELINLHLSYVPIFGELAVKMRKKRNKKRNKNRK